MYRLITPAISYGTNSPYVWQSSPQASFLSHQSQPNNYLNRFYQKNIGDLLLILIQQQIQKSVANHDTNLEEESSNKNGGNGDGGNNTDSDHLSSCRDYTPPEPLVQPQTNTYDEVLHSIKLLSQLIENNNVMESSKNYNDYLSNSAQSQNTIRHIYENGGRVVSQHKDYILAEDAKQNRYIVSRY